MHITIVAVGRIKEKYLTQGNNEYLKRLSAFAKLEIIEVADEKVPDNASETELQIIKTKEGEKISRYLKDGTYLIALDIGGKNLSSEELAGMISDLGLRGKSDLTFLIGGSVGLADSLVKRADFKLSFGRMTFPHQMMRLILLEQVYRGFKIMRGEPYHK